MAKTIAEINAKIASGDVVVVTAEEIIDIVDEDGAEKAAEKVDVVTTGTFGPMCSSGAFLNFGHANPRIKVQKAWLNGVNAYAGLAAVDLYIGCTEVP
ncbi:MAG TPA: homocysteine biosynthesis protein, partial [Armatimonadota bacterium]|nr:homocysteine biosynthesis protein [Armatimonadota bacterium]